MRSVRAAPHRAAFPALGTTAVLLVTDGAALAEGERLLRASLAEVDAAYSRFRDDSELVRLSAYEGRVAPVSPLLAGALQAALRAAAATDGLVDPTVGQTMIDLGYDRDFALMPADGTGPGAGDRRSEERSDEGGGSRQPGATASGASAVNSAHTPRPAPGWWRVRLDAETREVVVPRGVRLDLGSTGKAYAADRAAARIAALGCGVLVSLGGDLATAGPPPEGGWLVGVGDDHRAAAPGDPVVTIRSGALATSSVTQRAWRRGGRAVHHIVDPRTGDLAAPVWRTVSVAARSCVDANAAATAAIVRGEGADAWLDGAGLPARLVGHDGRVVTVGGWRSHA